MSRLFARFVFSLYRALGRAAGPLVRVLLRRRVTRGKELEDRLPERWGYSALPRPDKPLIWVHAASVGESLAILPLVQALHERAPGCQVLMTSTTVTSAKLLDQRLPDGVIHRFSPLDLPRAIERFLDHWRPALAIYVESELWPTQLRALDQRAIPRLLVNGRMSSRSYRGWRRYPGLAPELLEGFRLVAAEGQRSAERLRALGAQNVSAVGNLKQAAQPLPADPTHLAALEDAVAGRPLWLAASTHPGEDEQVFAAHAHLKEALPDLLTLLVPRHPVRGAEIAALAQAAGLVVARRSLDQAVTQETEIYIADTLGELGIFYRLAPIVFVGGSLMPVGGHNPLEPARLGCALLAGPHQDNVIEASAALQAAGALQLVRSQTALASAVLAWLQDPAARQAAGTAAESVGTAQAAVLEDCWQLLEPFLPALEPPGDGAAVEGDALHQGEDGTAGR
ncbi:MAG: 3-deoxy-D-manno-octulosonic acid transferase [Pseudomonadota bacterium]